MNYWYTKGVAGFSLRMLLVAIILVAWEAGVRAFEVPQYLLPPPTSIFMGLWRGLKSGIYVNHTAVTLGETFMGFALGSIFALVLGTAVALSRRVEFFLYPFIVMFQALAEGRTRPADRRVVRARPQLEDHPCGARRVLPADGEHHRRPALGG